MKITRRQLIGSAAAGAALSGVVPAALAAVVEKKVDLVPTFGKNHTFAA